MAHAHRDSVIAAAVLIAVAAASGFAQIAGGPTPARRPEPTVQLSDSQLQSIRVEPVGMHAFSRLLRAVGSIDFNQELLTQVFTPYQGRILKALVSVGDRVKKDQTLFTIDSPDLLQAESTLISAAGVLEFSNQNLERQRNLFRQSAAAQRDYQQAVSEQQTAEGALKAARAAVRVFGKTEAEIDKMIAERRVDSSLVVPSPITGLITARTAAPGLFVQPGAQPPVYIVADISTMWMLANVPERDVEELREGQELAATVGSLPGKVFSGKVVTISATIDPNTRRVLVRSEISNPRGELRGGMFANFVITLGPPDTTLAVPQDAVIREGDGSMTVWVTNGSAVFHQRLVTTGRQDRGYVEIKSGLSLGENVATDGALFIANQYANAH
jgi:cobalt-zinc-cadmium efflux system membrane fusion protein